MADAVVIGAGPNGLVAANRLADAGWSVVVVEAAPWPGGAARTAELVEPGYRNDVASGFHPLGFVSPHIGGYGLEPYGLRWCRSPYALAHPGPDGSAPAIGGDVEATIATFTANGSGPAGPEGWRSLLTRWERTSDALIASLLDPFPPIRAGLQMAKVLFRHDPLDFSRFALLPVRRLIEETFGTGRAADLGGRLLAGNALHADLSPEMSPSGILGWLLAMLAQDVGFPAPEGGAGAITDALVRRLEGRGGTVRCSSPATRVVIRGGRAVAVSVGGADPVTIDANRAVIADVGAPFLYRDLVGIDLVGPRIAGAIRRFQYDHATVKVDWTLDGPIPWHASEARQAGTIHVADDLDAMTLWSAQVAMGLIPARPYLVMGQLSMVDPTRQPAGKETAWAYTHVPQRVKGDAADEANAAITGEWDDGDGERLADRMEAEIERLAPGFRGLIRGRHLATPWSLSEDNPNLAGGAIGGGTTQLHQQFVFRPVPGLGRSETPIAGLFLGSASAHPGAGVHGACGASAARAALLADRHPRATAFLRRR